MGFSEAVGTNDIGPEQKAAEDTVRRSHYKIARERESQKASVILEDAHLRKDAVWKGWILGTHVH